MCERLGTGHCFESARDFCSPIESRAQVFWESKSGSGACVSEYGFEWTGHVNAFPFIVLNIVLQHSHLTGYRLSHDSPDFLMRKLADYAFMLRDYRFALSIYETLKKDFQNSESHIKYLAGAQV